MEEKYAKLVDLLAKNGFTAHYFADNAAAKAYLAEQIKGETVGFGGSVTVDQLGLYDLLAQENKVLWHWKNVEDKDHFNDFTAYVTSANAIAETGELVNIDGAGNRVSATLYGPQKVYFVCGVNKVEPTLDAAIARARNVASPLNAKSKNKNTPCVNLGRCTDCNSPDRICRAMVIYMQPMMGKHHEVILIGEELGF